MKWLSTRYAYPLVIFVIMVSVALQLAWLNQLFRAQRVQVKHDLEETVAQSAEMSTYLSLVPGHEHSPNFRDFFLSPEWLQFKQAYNNMRFDYISSRFSQDTVGDSTFVTISLRIYNGISPKNHVRHIKRYDTKTTVEQERVLDTIDFRRMDSLVNERFSQLGVPLKNYFTVYNYDDNKKPPEGISSQTPTGAAFRSQQYSYDLRFFRMYQAVVPSVDRLVFYRMRYYLVSSIFMLLLTVAVFYFILRLMHKQRMYTQARVSFTSNMTHELKTPVATVAIALETIVENHLENDPQTLRNYLEISRGELRRLNLMIDKVLNLEQMDYGHDKLRTELFDVQQGLQEIIIAMRPQIENTKAVVLFKPLTAPCFISGDPVHLTNVFYNLVENAMKYGGQGVKLEITCVCSTHEVKISFKDNGPGIASDYHQQVFERFFRVPARTNDIHNVKGSGLGLNYVNQIVKKHGGHIKLESEPGHGSNFILYFPAVS